MVGVRLGVGGVLTRAGGRVAGPEGGRAAPAGGGPTGGVDGGLLLPGGLVAGLVGERGWFDGGVRFGCDIGVVAAGTAVGAGGGGPPGRMVPTPRPLDTAVTAGVAPGGWGFAPVGDGA